MPMRHSYQPEPRSPVRSALYARNFLGIHQHDPLPSRAVRASARRLRSAPGTLPSTSTAASRAGGASIPSTRRRTQVNQRCSRRGAIASPPISVNRPGGGAVPRHRQSDVQPHERAPLQADIGKIGLFRPDSDDDSCARASRRRRVAQQTKRLLLLRNDVEARGREAALQARVIIAQQLLNLREAASSTHLQRVVDTTALCRLPSHSRYNEVSSPVRRTNIVRLRSRPAPSAPFKPNLRSICCWDCSAGWSPARLPFALDWMENTIKTGRLAERVALLGVIPPREERDARRSCGARSDLSESFVGPDSAQFSTDHGFRDFVLDQHLPRAKAIHLPRSRSAFAGEPRPSAAERATSQADVPGASADAHGLSSLLPVSDYLEACVHPPTRRAVLLLGRPHPLPIGRAARLRPLRAAARRAAAVDYVSSRAAGPRLPTSALASHCAGRVRIVPADPARGALNASTLRDRARTWSHPHQVQCQEYGTAPLRLRYCDDAILSRRRQPQRQIPLLRASRRGYEERPRRVLRVRVPAIRGLPPSHPLSDRPARPLPAESIAAHRCRPLFAAVVAGSWSCSCGAPRRHPRPLSCTRHRYRRAARVEPFRALPRREQAGGSPSDPLMEDGLRRRNYAPARLQLAAYYTHRSL